jgi:hypothetical protein
MKPDPYTVASGFLDMKTIRLAVTQLCARQMIQDHAFLQGAELSHFRDEAARRLILDFSAKVASKKYEVKTVRFPADWKQAVKLRFAKPGTWLGQKILKRWPIQYTEVTLEASAYYPDIEIRGHQAFVEIVHAARIRSYDE